MKTFNQRLQSSKTLHLKPVFIRWGVMEGTIERMNDMEKLKFVEDLCVFHEPL